MPSGENFSHAYILSGDAAQVEARAGELTAAMLCSGAGGEKPCGVCRDCVKLRRAVHPDRIELRRLTDEKGRPRREIYVEQIRELAAGAATLPNEAAWKVYVVYDAGAMNPSAQNAFLKLLEEPPSFDVFLLLCDSAEQLLDTVRSRCVHIHLQGAEDAPGAEARAQAEKYLDCAAAKNAVGLLAFLNANAEMSGAEATEFVEAVRALLTDMLCGRLPDLNMPAEELLRLAGLMERSREYLRRNVAVKHIFGLLSARTIILR